MMMLKPEVKPQGVRDMSFLHMNPHILNTHPTDVISRTWMLA